MNLASCTVYRWAFVGVAGVAVSGCSSSGASPALAAQPYLRTGTLSLGVAAPAGSALRTREYLSASAASVALTVSGVAAPVIADVGPTSPDCTTSGTQRTCTIGLAAPVGTDTITATLFDAAGGKGNVLGIGTSTVPVTRDGFSARVQVLGAAAAVRLSAGTAAFTNGIAATAAVTVAVLDAGGNAIAGTYAYPVTLTVSDPAVFSITPIVLTASGQTVTLTYNGTPDVAYVTVGGTAHDVAGNAIVPVTVNVAGSPPLGLSQASQQFLSIGVTSSPVTIAGSSATNYAAMTVATSDAAVATAKLDPTHHAFTVTSTGIGSATITVGPSDGSAVPADFGVAVATTTVKPSAR